jgi:hypothetical protein
MQFPKSDFTKQGESAFLSSNFPSKQHRKMNFQRVAQALAIAAMIAMLSTPVLNFLSPTKILYIVVSLVCGVFMLCTEYPVFSFIFSKESRCGRYLASLQSPIYKCCSYAAYSVAISLSMGRIFNFYLVSPILTLLTSVCYGISIFVDRKESSTTSFPQQSSGSEAQRTNSLV